MVTRPAAASTHLTYLGFLSLFAVTVGQIATDGSRGWRIRKKASNLKISTVSTLRSLSLHFVDDRDMILSRLMSPIQRRYLGRRRR